MFMFIGWSSLASSDWLLCLPCSSHSRQQFPGLRGGAAPERQWRQAHRRHQAAKPVAGVRQGGQLLEGQFHTNYSHVQLILGSLHVKLCCVYMLDCFATFSDFERQQKCFQFNCDDFNFPQHEVTVGSAAKMFLLRTFRCPSGSETARVMRDAAENPILLYLSTFQNIQTHTFFPEGTLFSIGFSVNVCVFLSNWMNRIILWITIFFMLSWLWN